MIVACKEFETKISALIDDELTESERSEVLEHISGCPACKAYWEELLAVGAILREETPAPAGFADAVMTRIHETKQDAAPRKILAFPGIKRYAAMAACAAVVVLGVWALNGSQGLSLNESAVNNCAAPEMYAVMDSGADIRSTDNCVSDTCESDEASGLPPSDCERDATYACPAGFAAEITTGSDLAAGWVDDNLGRDWISGERYPLTPEEYSALRTLLQDAGEPFSEIMGSESSGTYLLLAE